MKQIVVIIGEYHSCQLRTKFFDILLSRLTPYAEEILGDNQCGQILIIYFAFVKYLRKYGNKMKQCVRSM